MRYEKEGDAAVSSFWTFAIEPECTGYDLCMSVLRMDPATQTRAKVHGRKDPEGTLGRLGVALYKVDEAESVDSAQQLQLQKKKSQRNSILLMNRNRSDVLELLDNMSREEAAKSAGTKPSTNNNNNNENESESTDYDAASTTAASTTIDSPTASVYTYSSSSASLAPYTGNSSSISTAPGATSTSTSAPTTGSNTSSPREDDENGDCEDDRDDDENSGEEFDPSAPNVVRVSATERIAGHTSGWKSSRDGYFVVYDTSSSATAASVTSAAKVPVVPPSGHSTRQARGKNSSSRGGCRGYGEDDSTSDGGRSVCGAILVDMRSGGAGEQTSEAWIPEEDILWVSRISSGSFSRVYKGVYRNRYVAIKMLKGGLSARNIEEFRKEFRVMKSVRHPNLLECYGASFEHNKLSYVIEYCQRGTLVHVMTDPSLTIGWEHATDFFAQALRGLCFLHEYTPPIVHRDLKSQNLLVTRNYEIKIGDFGLSRFNTASNNPTLSNMCGTMTHCAPEIFSGEVFTTKSDIYSMGMILWELCNRVATGSYSPPYAEFPNIVLDIQIIAQAATKNLRPTIPAGVPSALAGLIARCWDKDPAARPEAPQLLRLVDALPQRRMGLFNRPTARKKRAGATTAAAQAHRHQRNISAKLVPQSQLLQQTQQQLLTNVSSISSSSVSSGCSSSSSSQNSHFKKPQQAKPPLPPPLNTFSTSNTTNTISSTASNKATINSTATTVTTTTTTTTYSTPSSLPLSSPPSSPQSLLQPLQQQTQQ